MNRNFSRIFKVLFFISLIVIIDQFVGRILRKLYFHQKTGQNYSLSYTFINCTADILIFGASQAQHNYDSRIISDSLKMTCYNAGQDGGHSILLQYAQIKVITARYIPKIIILEFTTDNIVKLPVAYEKLSILLPYYSLYPELDELIRLRSSFESVKLLSAIYPFNSNVINILRYNTTSHSARKKDYDGYIPLNGKMNIDMLKNLQKPLTEPELFVDTNMVNALIHIIDICKKKNITLEIVSSPHYHNINDKRNPPSSIATIALDIIRKNDANYLNLTFDSAFAGHLNWFKDKVHLNQEGAKIFSSKIAHWMKTNQKSAFR